MRKIKKTNTIDEWEDVMHWNKGPVYWLNSAACIAGVVIITLKGIMCSELVI